MQAVPFAAAALAGNMLVLRRSRHHTLEALQIGAALKGGFALFLTKLASNGPGLGLVYIIGFAIPPAAVAHYIAAERLLMGSANALWPVMQLLMPEIASRLERDPSGAERLLARGIGALVAIGLVLALVLFGFAPWIIALLFGERFGPAVEALRIIALALPFMALTSALTGGVFVARKADWQLNGLVMGSAVLSAVLALTLIARMIPGACRGSGSASRWRWRWR